MNSLPEVRIAELSANVSWKLLGSFTSEQCYVSRNWDYEHGERLVLGQGGRIVEASIFHHSLKGVPVKTVIELPTSFGCQMRCPHCASGDIGAAVPLSVVDLAGVYAATAARVEGPRLIRAFLT